MLYLKNSGIFCVCLKQTGHVKINLQLIYYSCYVSQIKWQVGVGSQRTAVKYQQSVVEQQGPVLYKEIYVALLTH